MRPGCYVPWDGDGLLHDGRIDRHALDAALVDGAGFAPSLDGLGQQPFHTFLTDPLAPACQRGRIDGQAVLKEGLASEMLVVRVLDPPC